MLRVYFSFLQKNLNFLRPDLLDWDGTSTILTLPRLGRGFEARGTKLPYATKKRYTVGYYAPVTFPKIYLGKFWNIFFWQILITWPIMTSSVTWAKFRNLEKRYLGMGMIYRWKEGLIGFSTSPKPTSYLNPFTSYGNFSDQPIRRLHFFNRVTSAHILCMMGYFFIFW